MEPLNKALIAQLYGVEDTRVFAIVDGASAPELLGQLDEHRPEYECLYRGELTPDLAYVAPYLIQLEMESEFAEWLMEQGWGRHCGIYAISAADLRTLRRHFRTFLMVHSEDGKPLYFRYYDPRVMRVYLPSCNAGELAAMFGPVVRYVLEGEDPETLLSFENASGALRERKVALPKNESASSSKL